MQTVPTDQMSAAPVRVLIADDHPMMREGISAVVAAHAAMEIVATATDGAQAIAEFERHRPDVSLIDMQMPVKDGLEAILAIRALQPDARIIVLTTFGGDARVAAALRAGAAAYLLKDVPGPVLLATIMQLHHSKPVVANDALRDVGSLHSISRLSAREVSVLRLVAVGHANRDIGAALSITEATVKTHMSTILVKLGARDRAHAVTIGLQRGYLEM